MLNISNSDIGSKIDQSKFQTLPRVEAKKSNRVLRRLIMWTLICMFLIGFLPWTQNIRSNGTVSTLAPDQRPTTINSIIAGKIENWYVREGDQVKKGDTIARISEIKDAYFDSELLPRTKQQLDLKEQTVRSYEDKVTAQESQLAALSNQLGLQTEQARIKLKQAELKVQNDSIAYDAALVSYLTAEKQFNRIDSLYKAGLKSLIDLEGRNLKLQQAKAYEVEAKNKWLNSRSELINLKLDISTIATKYKNDIAKIESDKFSTLSSKYDAESMVNKLKNQYTNYEVRSGLYYITAPQDGYIAKTFITGVGQTLKEGDPLVSLMPINYDLAVAIYVEPLDLPLLSVGQHVRIQFDGWPAIVFSGWPNVSYGTYGGKIYAIDQNISPTGKYRILVEPEVDDHPWPKALRFGSGTKTMILLNDVPIWYELWRNVNGFPPNFYQHDDAQTDDGSKKK